jgi:hypothetical protein
MPPATVARYPAADGSHELLSSLHNHSDPTRPGLSAGLFFASTSGVYWRLLETNHCQLLMWVNKTLQMPPQDRFP